MKKTLVLIGILALIFTGRFVGLFECSAAKFEYERIESTIYNPNWYGSEYNIIELNSYNTWYEEALIDFLPQEDKLLMRVTDSLEHFALDLSLDNYRFVKSGGGIQLCLDNMNIQIDKTKSGIFENKYDVFIDTDLQYHHYWKEGDIDYIRPKYDMKFKLKTKLTTHGLVTPFFVNTYLKQLYLFELNKIAKDYFGIYKVGE